MASLDHSARPLSFASARASADFSSFSSPLASRARPTSDVIFNQPTPSAVSANNNNLRTRRYPQHGAVINTRSSIPSALRMRHDIRADDSGADAEDPEHMDFLAEQWLSELENYEGTLDALTAPSSASSASSSSPSNSTSASSSTGNPFKSELSAIETWFSCVLSEPERTAALYTLLQHTTQVQIRFFISVLRQMEMKRLDPAMVRMLDSESRVAVGVKRTQQQPMQETKRASVTGLSRYEDESDQEVTLDEHASAGGARAISPIGSEKSAGRPPSVDLDLPSSSGSSNSSSEAAPAPASTKFQFSASSSSPSSVPASWASMRNTPVSKSASGSTSAPASASVDAQTTLANAEIIANATAMKLAALSTVNNRILLDSDVRKFRRKNLLGQAAPLSSSPFGGMMYNEAGQVVPVPAQMTPNYRPPSVQQQAFMTPSPATSSSPFVSGSRGRKWQPQQPAQVPSSLFSSPASFQLQPHTPAKPQSPSFQFPSLSLGLGIGSSPFSDWYNMSSSPLSAAVASSPMPTAQSASTQQSKSFQRGRPSPSPSPSTASTTSSSSSSKSTSKNSFMPTSRADVTSPARDSSSQLPDNALLNDIPAWLRSLRLHKYTDNLKDLKWEDLVHLSEDQLVDRGVSALGARRKMLKIFKTVREAKYSWDQNKDDNQISAGSEETA
ncbi:hypothetical protein V1517DRAFT_338297 [Lipomyces orientalis]|uniref:Uncharacterized protein n=1 Tax=Lipomyces orientalis TaxID=1233043 RepID=A0ACC3TP61_9ASCO